MQIQLIQNEEQKKSLLITATTCIILLLLFWIIRVNMYTPAPQAAPIYIPVEPQPDPPLPMPELKETGGGAITTPNNNPGNKEGGSTNPTNSNQSSQRESSSPKATDVNNPETGDIAKSTESRKPGAIFNKTNPKPSEGKDDFGDATTSTSDKNGPGGGPKGNGSPYGAGDDKTPGAFNNKLSSEIDFEGIVYAKLKVAPDGTPIEFIEITKRTTTKTPALKLKIEQDIKRKLKNLKCRPHTSEYIEEFKFVYKKS